MLLDPWTPAPFQSNFIKSHRAWERRWALVFAAFFFLDPLSGFFSWHWAANLIIPQFALLISFIAFHAMNGYVTKAAKRRRSSSRPLTSQILCPINFWPDRQVSIKESAVLRAHARHTATTATLKERAPSFSIDVKKFSVGTSTISCRSSSLAHVTLIFLPLSLSLFFSFYGGGITFLHVPDTVGQIFAAIFLLVTKRLGGQQSSRHHGRRSALLFTPLSLWLPSLSLRVEIPTFIPCAIAREQIVFSRRENNPRREKLFISSSGSEFVRANLKEWLAFSALMRGAAKLKGPSKRWQFQRGTAVRGGANKRDRVDQITRKCTSLCKSQFCNGLSFIDNERHGRPGRSGDYCRVRYNCVLMM